MKDIFKSKFDLDTMVKRLFSRFPYTTVLLILEFLGLCYLVNIDSFDKNEFILQVILMGGFASIMFTITIQLLSERLQFKSSIKLILNLVAILGTALLTALFMYKDVQSYNNLQQAFTGNLYRELILMLISFVSIFFIPFFKDTDSKNWWNFLISSFGRALVSVLYAVVVFIGLALALAAVDTFWEFQLLGDQQYAMVWFFAAVIVAPLHFLNGVYLYKVNAELIELPRFLLIFAKFILTPLVIIYTVILYPYIFSFPFRSEWPANEATGYILALLVLGFTGIVLFYGLDKDSKDTRFAKRFTKVFTGVALPPILFWAYSLYLRIDAYKLTVNRFALMAVIVWFLAVTIYYLTVKVTQAKYILGTFLGLLIVVYYFPFSAFYWGEHAQLNRLTELYEDNNLIQDGKMIRGQNGTSTLNDIIGESVVYLNQYHTLRKLEPKLSSELKTRLKIDSNYYAKDLDYWYGSTSKVFFATITLDSGEIDSAENIRIVLIGDGIQIPDTYTNVQDVYLYPNHSGELIEINNEKIIFQPDLDDERFSREICDNDLPSEKYYGYMDLCTADVALMTVKLNQGVLIIDEFNATVNYDGTLEIYSLDGYLFTN